jgi:hypothetical protein
MFLTKRKEDFVSRQPRVLRFFALIGEKPTPSRWSCPVNLWDCRGSQYRGE